MTTGDVTDPDNNHGRFCSRGEVRLGLYANFRGEAPPASAVVVFWNSIAVIGDLLPLPLVMGLPPVAVVVQRGRRHFDWGSLGYVLLHQSCSIVERVDQIGVYHGALDSVCRLYHHVVSLQRGGNRRVGVRVHSSSGFTLAEVRAGSMALGASTMGQGLVLEPPTWAWGDVGVWWQPSSWVGKSGTVWRRHGSDCWKRGSVGFRSFINHCCNNRILVMQVTGGLQCQTAGGLYWENWGWTSDRPISRCAGCTPVEEVGSRQRNICALPLFSCCRSDQGWKWSRVKGLV